MLLFMVLLLVYISVYSALVAGSTVSLLYEVRSKNNIFIYSKHSHPLSTHFPSGIRTSQTVLQSCFGNVLQYLRRICFTSSPVSKRRPFNADLNIVKKKYWVAGLGSREAGRVLAQNSKLTRSVSCLVTILFCFSVKIWHELEILTSFTSYLTDPWFSKSKSHQFRSTTDYLLLFRENFPHNRHEHWTLHSGTGTKRGVSNPKASSC